MTKISSRYLFLSKKLFPAVWFGFLAFFVVTGFQSGAIAENPLALIAPCLMAAFGFVLMKKLIWDLVDEVYDCGDHLLVRNNGEEDRVSLSNVINVSVSTYLNPPRIALRLRTASKFGTEIAFSPASPFTLNPFARNQIGEDLIVRVDNARSSRAV